MELKIFLVFVALILIPVHGQFFASMIRSVSEPFHQMTKPMRSFAARSIDTLSNFLPEDLGMVVKQFGHCYGTDDWVDPYLGVVSSDFSTYCDERCSRSVPGVLCCMPQSPKYLDVRFLLFKRESPNQGYDLSWEDVNEWNYFYDAEKVIFATHGFMEKVTPGTWLYKVKDGWFSQPRNDSPSHFVIVDWTRGNRMNYFQAAANVRVLGMMIGHVIARSNIAQRSLVIGFSLGAQIVGEAGKYVNRKTGQLINECHGLDPAGPFFDGCSSEVVLDRSDCRIVQVIHTSAPTKPKVGPLEADFGSSVKAGHCDYWINCGRGPQPKCLLPKFQEMLTLLLNRDLSPEGIKERIDEISCSHTRGHDIYISQLSGTCDFSAYECPDCLTTPKCRGTIGRKFGPLVIGAPCESEHWIDLFVKTSKDGKPLC